MISMSRYYYVCRAYVPNVHEDDGCLYDICEMVDGYETVLYSVNGRTAAEKCLKMLNNGLNVLEVGWEHDYTESHYQVRRGGK